MNILWSAALLLKMLISSRWATTLITDLQKWLNLILVSPQLNNTDTGKFLGKLVLREQCFTSLLDLPLNSLTAVAHSVKLERVFGNINHARFPETV